MSKKTVIKAKKKKVINSKRKRTQITEGEIVIIPVEEALRPDFFNAMMNFQYGDETFPIKTNMVKK